MSKTSKFVEVESAAKEIEQPARHANAVRKSENIFEASLPATYSGLLAECNEFKIHCDSLTLETHCILGLADEAKKLRAKVADVKKIKRFGGKHFSR